MKKKTKYKVGVALGSGAARGLSHIGVLRALEDLGIYPEVVAGTSSGSLVGAAYSAGRLNELEDWLKGLEWKDVVSFFDFTLSGGLIKGNKLFNYFKNYFGEKKIEDLNLPFAAVACELETGQEIWLRSGEVLPAVRSSIALPGVITPVYYKGKWLIDGGVVNPVPVSVCRALGAEYIIAVDLNAHLMAKNTFTKKKNKEQSSESETDPEKKSWWRSPKEFYNKLKVQQDEDENPDGRPSLMEVINTSINIMEVRITRSRMAGDPPDILLTPKLTDIGMMEFHRFKECFMEGRRVVELAKESLLSIIED
ncbi:MAG: patatin-like phospholipase RssA [Leptospiraceae bacterium]|nr:patatin-like phospholipase RssA [Leptospiraceae bacterium]MCP5500543.1 patatin-like phospholipase RssA [Leptospiraceae bacterium]